MTHPNTPADAHQTAFQAAIETCQEQGAQMTPLREAVLARLCAIDHPVGAYDLKDLVAADLGRPLSATSIYRTLDFLCDYSVATRIESRNAYIACAQPGGRQASVLFVCNDCGTSSEIENKKIETLLSANADELGFTIDHRVVELSGSCADCRVTAV